jgi:hypothetical protein
LIGEYEYENVGGEEIREQVIFLPAVLFNWYEAALKDRPVVL